jgi:zinc protease
MRLRLLRGHYGPRGSLLELTGDVTPAEARKLAEEAFGKWSSSCRAG